MNVKKMNSECSKAKKKGERKLRVQVAFKVIKKKTKVWGWRVKGKNEGCRVKKEVNGCKRNLKSIQLKLREGWSEK